MSLQEALTENTAARRKVMPEDHWNTIDGSIRALKETGIQSATLKAGDKAPDFTLPNALGEMVSSEALRRKGPLVISFYRGTWCSYCNVEIRALQQNLAEIRALGAELVAITPEVPDETVSMSEKHGLEFEVLSDVGNAVAKSYGLVWTLPDDVRGLYGKIGIDLERSNGDDSWQLPIPGTFVVSQDGVLIEAFADPDYRNRLDPAVVLEALGR